MTKSDGEAHLDLHIRAAQLPCPQHEYHFARDIVGHGPGIRARLKSAGLKNWRFDFAWPDHMLAVEIEGGTWANGRHTRGAGFEGDCFKYNEAALAGWTVLRFTTGMVTSGKALDTLQKFFTGPGMCAKMKPDNSPHKTTGGIK